MESAPKAEFDDHVLQRAKALVAEIEAGHQQEAGHILDELTRAHEQSLFHMICRMTRDFHDSLKNGVQIDSRLAQIADEEIPDAKARLQHVITMTDQAANKTLSVVETSLPLCDKLEAHSSEIKARWDRFTRREMEPEEFRELVRELGEFLELLNNDVAELKSGLTEVLMAQDFQDLTGQIISRVIRLVGDMEDQLVALIKSAGISPENQPVEAAEKTDKKSKPAGEDLEGPQIPGMKSADAVSGQDEVDDLLSSLGF